MCLVEIENAEKLVIACLTNVESNINILTDTIAVKKARENVLETLLLNHPLDCPICDQAGECDLQDQAKIFGNVFNKMYSKRRGVEDKHCGSLIKTIMTRCIHCTRCVRFGTEIAGVEFFGTLNRGNTTEIGMYTKKLFESNISGNVIDLCPVGALTSKPYAFKTRPWELRSVESIDLTDSLGSQLFVNYKESSISRILPKTNMYLNGNIISDIARFSYDALENNRIYDIYKVDDRKNLELTTWENFNKFIINSKNQKITFLLNEQLDLKTLNKLKFLITLYKNIKVRSYSRFNEYKNFYTSLKLNSNLFLEKNNNMCILIGSNLKTENAVLNTKIRLQTLENDYKLFSMGNKYNSKSLIKFTNLHLEETLTLFEGKLKNLSQSIFNAYSPKFIFGEGFKKRISSLNTIKNNILKINYSIQTLVINSSTNTEGNFFLGIKSLNLKEINTSDFIFCLSINDNIFIRKLLSTYKNPIVFFNTHFLTFFKKNSMIVPTLSKFFEDSGIYINMFQSSQKSQKIFPGLNNLKSINFFIEKLFNVSSFNSNHLKFILETVQTSTPSSSFQKTNFSLLFFKRILNKNIFNLISLYPSKFFLENTFKTDTFIKNSYYMNSHMLHKQSKFN